MAVKMQKLYLFAVIIFGIFHWLNFYLLTASPKSLSWELKNFTVNDWRKETMYLEVLHDSVENRILPFKVPNLKEVFMVKDNFLGAPIWSMVPQYFLMAFLSPMLAIITNHLLMFGVGCWGLWLLAHKYQLGAGSFWLMAIIFNLNGYFVEKVTAYGPGQMGYYFLPLFFYTLFKIHDANQLSVRKQWYEGTMMGLILAGILFQGSLHIYVEAITFLIFFAILRRCLWGFLLVSLVTTFALGMVRLLPAAMTFGHQANVHSNWGYLNPIKVFKAMLVIYHASNNPPANGWWEWSFYISLFGLVLLLIFGFMPLFRKKEWVILKNWGAFYLPFYVFIIISFWKFRKFIIPDVIPLLNAESWPSRYIIFPVLLLTIIAAINLEGFWRSIKSSLLKGTLICTLALLTLSLLKHSWFWRMHYAQNAFEQALQQEAIKFDTIHLTISSHYSVSLYTWSFWIGLWCSILTFLFCCLWLWRQKRRA